METGEAPQGHIRDLVERITPSVLRSLREDKTDVNEMVVDHVKQTVPRLLDSSRAQLVSTSGVL